jgi:hypothetical protein
MKKLFYSKKIKTKKKLIKIIKKNFEWKNYFIQKKILNEKN